MVAANQQVSRVRDRPARVRRTSSRLDVIDQEGARRRCTGRARPDHRSGRRIRVHRPSSRARSSKATPSACGGSRAATRPSSESTLHRDGDVATHGRLDGEDSILVVDRPRSATRSRPRAVALDSRAPTVAAALDQVRGSPPPTTPRAGTIALARAGGTVGEWAGALREVRRSSAARPRRQVHAPPSPTSTQPRARTRRVGRARHSAADCCGQAGSTASNGPSRSQSRARDARHGGRVPGIRLTPAQIAAAARDEDVDIVAVDPVGLPTGPGARDDPGCGRRATRRWCRRNHPRVYQRRLLEAGVARVYTPKDYRIARSWRTLAELGCKHVCCSGRGRTSR